MHYYQFNIGDYARRTKYLSDTQDLAYRRLLDLYYLQEHGFPNDIDEISDSIGFNGRSTDVEKVLNKFFLLDGEIWKNERADEEIAKYYKTISSASEAGKASAAARKARKLDGVQRVLNTRSTDVVLTKNQEPRTNIKNSCASSEGAKVKNMYSRAFLDFYELYPRKKSKADAAKAFKKIHPNEYPNVKSGLMAAIGSADWKDINFIPYPASWLNSRGWEDEIRQPGESTSTKPWYLTASGIEAKVKEINFDTKGELLVVYKIRLFKQLGITSEIIRKANLDWA